MGLCRNCYNKYYYVSNRYKMSFKDFVMAKDTTRYDLNSSIPHQKFENSYTNFVKAYTQEPKQQKTMLAKQLGISRETLYKYLRIYNGENTNEKNKV